MAEHRVARDQDFCPGAYHISHGVYSNPAVDLYSVIQPPLRPQFRQPPDLMHCAGNEFLPAKARIHRHNQHIIHQVEHLAEHLNRGRRIDHHARGYVMIANQMQSTIQVAAGFLMDRNPVRPSRCEVGNVLVRILDHQVTIQRQFGRLPQRLHNWRSDGDIGHEVSIHYIHMDNRSSALGRRADLIRQARKIRRQYRRC